MRARPTMTDKEVTEWVRIHSAAGEGGESASALNERAMTDSRTQRADKYRSLVPGVESGPTPAALCVRVTRTKL
jgi:hypothetical protein